MADRTFEKRHDHVLRDVDALKDVPNFGDMFFETTEPDNYGREQRAYEMNRDGFSLLAMGFTGKKALEWKVKYIEAFNKMEDTIKSGSILEEKSDKLKVMEMNARTRMARTYIQLANVDTLSKEYKNILVAKASETLSGEQLLPLPKAVKKTYSAKEIGDILGISACKVGRIANEHNFKTDKFGEYYRDKSQHSNREVDTFRYFENAVDEFRKYL